MEASALDFDWHHDFPEKERDEMVQDLARHCERLFDAIMRDEWELIAERLAAFDARQVSAFDILIKFNSERKRFEGTVFEFAMGCRAWRALSELIKAGLGRGHPVAMRFLSDLLFAIDNSPEDAADLPLWTEVVQRGLEPPTASAAWDILNSPAMASLGPRSRGICVDVARRVIAEFERGECESEALHPNVGDSSMEHRLRL